MGLKKALKDKKLEKVKIKICTMNSQISLKLQSITKIKTKVEINTDFLSLISIC